MSAKFLRRGEVGHIWPTVCILNCSIALSSCICSRRFASLLSPSICCQKNYHFNDIFGSILKPPTSHQKLFCSLPLSTVSRAIFRRYTQVMVKAKQHSTTSLILKCKIRQHEFVNSDVLLKGRSRACQAF